MGRITFSKYSHANINKNRVRLSQLLNGKSVLLSLECYKILQQCIAEKLTIDEFLNCIEDLDDRIYFKNLIEKLKELSIVVDNGIEECVRIGSIVIELTHRCNLACKHCSLSAHTLHNAEYFGTEEIISIIKNIIALNPENICLTGGEPLVRKDIFLILDYLKHNYKGVLSIMTNATLISPQNVNKLADYISVWDISLDGVNEETCSCIRGAGVFGKVIESIRLLQNAGVKNISLSMVETSATQRYIKEFNELNKKLGTHPIIRAFEEQGRGKENADILRPESISNNYEDMVKIAEEIGCSRKEVGSCFTCGAALTEFFVNYKGEVYPCAPFDDKKFMICSALMDNFAEYIVSGEYMESYGYINLKKFLPQNYDQCFECPENIFCWSCAHDIYQKSLDQNEFRNRCYLRKKELQYIWIE